MPIFFLEENQTLDVAFASPPGAPGIAYHISYKEIDGLKGREKWCVEKTLGGTLTNSATLLTCPADKRIEVEYYSFRNKNASSCDITVSVNGGEIIGLSAFTSGDNILPHGIFSSDGLQRSSGAPGQNAVMVVTSDTSTTIGTGTKVFDFVSSVANLGIALGARVRVTDNDTPTNYMEGDVTAISTTDIEVEVDYIAGSGTDDDWSIGIIGRRGTDGTNGSDGTDGTDGIDGTDGADAVMTRVSNSSVSLTAASKTFDYTVPSSNIGWLIGTRLRAWYNASNYMEGQVTSVSSTQVIVSMDYVVGSGSQAVWNLSVAGDRGATGAAGSNGSNGTNGTNGLNADLTRTSTSGPIAIGTGSKVFSYTASSNLGWAIGTRLRATEDGGSGHYVEGFVTSVSSTSVTISSDSFVGSGSYSSWAIGLAGNQRVVTDIRTGVSLTANGTTTINTTLNGDYTDHAIYTSQITGGTTENNLIDITNASAEKYYKIVVSRDATAGTKTINFAGSGRTYNRSWGTGTQAIAVSERWLFLVSAVSATEFDVVAQPV